MVLVRALAAFVALWWWDEGHVLEPAPGAARHGRTRWLLLAAFFLGVAAGSKYQALIFLPLVAVFVARRERRGAGPEHAVRLLVVPQGPEGFRGAPLGADAVDARRVD